MTKKLLLTAAALSAMALAGAANAGVLSTNSTISGKTVNAGVAGGATAAVYNIASEYTFPTAGLATDDTVAGKKNVFEFNDLDNELVIAPSASGLTFVVTYNLTGAAKFANVSSAKVTLGTLVGSVTPVLSDGGKTLKAYVTVSGAAADVTINSVKLEGFDLAVTGKETIKVSYSLQQVIAGQNVDLDSSAATSVVGFSSVFGDFFKVANSSVLAALTDFKKFKESGMTGGVVVPVGGASATTAGWTTTKKTVYTDLKATAAGAIDTIITSAEVTVSGPQVKDMVAAVGVATLPTDATATSAKYTLAGAALDANLALAPVAGTVIASGAYNAVIKPTYATNWSGPATIERSLLTIGLDGTNFYAPWFALDNGTANSSLRVANNGTAAVGPIVVSLKANNGAAAPTGTYTIPTVAAGTFVTVNGTQLKAAFGSTAGNGDLLVTIQSQANGVSAKVRTTQVTGQIYENTLGATPPAN